LPRAKYHLDGDHADERLFDDSHLYGDVPGGATGYPPASLRGRRDRWRDRAARVPTYHAAVAAAGDYARRYPRHDRHLSGVRTNLGDDPRRAATHDACTAVFDLPEDAGHRYAGRGWLRRRDVVHPGRDHYHDQHHPTSLYRALDRT